MFHDQRPVVPVASSTALGSAGIGDGPSQSHRHGIAHLRKSFESHACVPLIDFSSCRGRPHRPILPLNSKGSKMSVGKRVGSTLLRQCVVHAPKRRCYASAATAASSLPVEFRNTIEVWCPGTRVSRALTRKQKEVSLPTPDPASDSQTARMVNSYTPFMVPTYVRPPPMFQRGEGCNLWDIENRRYLDFTVC